MTSPLLNLYTKRHDKLLIELQGAKPSDAVAKIRSVLQQIERPFSDQTLAGYTEVRIAHHALAMISEALPLLASVGATANPVDEGPAFQSAGRRIGMRFLWLLVLLSFAAAAMSIYWHDSNLAALGFVVIALLAAIGGSMVVAKKDRPLESRLEAGVNVHVDARVVDSQLNRILRAADDLVAVATQKTKQAPLQPVIDPEAMLKLLQGLIAHRITPDPEESASDLAGQAERALRSAGITPVQYSKDKASLFDDQPAGISEIRTLRPALVDGEEQLIRRGTVLVPVQQS